MQNLNFANCPICWHIAKPDRLDQLIKKRIIDFEMSQWVTDLFSPFFFHDSLNCITLFLGLCDLNVFSAKFRSRTQSMVKISSALKRFLHTACVVTVDFNLFNMGTKINMCCFCVWHVPKVPLLYAPGWLYTKCWEVAYLSTICLVLLGFILLTLFPYISSFVLHSAELTVSTCS